MGNIPEEFASLQQRARGTESARADLGYRSKDGDLEDIERDVVAEERLFWNNRRDADLRTDGHCSYGIDQAAMIYHGGSELNRYGNQDSSYVIDNLTFDAEADLPRIDKDGGYSPVNVRALDDYLGAMWCSLAIAHNINLAAYLCFLGVFGGLVDSA